MGHEWATDWHEPAPLSLPAGYLDGEPDLLRAILSRRGYRTADAARAFLDPLAFRLPDLPLALALSRAVQRLVRALEQDELVAVWGDYDVDGQTATALLTGALRQAGLRVTFYIPPCDGDTRGLTSAGIQDLAGQGCRLLVTCDCGTNEVDLVARARALGVEVIITDHHAQSAPLPEALAVLNSSAVARDDPVFGLSGVGVAYLLARGLLRERGMAREANDWLDLVALGTVADVVASTPANRALLARGLLRLWQQPRPGVRALLDLSGRHPSTLDTETISFSLGPILNAAGRLGSPCDGVELLLTDDPAAAQRLAARLWTLKEERNRLAATVEAAVVAQIGRDDPTGPIVVAGVDWHPAVLGRVAGAVAHHSGRQAVVIGIPSAGGPARGSARADGEIDLC
ncbi:MAG TPA: DHH family phosphoesterase, partial [Chloroflexota bacterium]|nr:DHH family phosphoesterase [Chloroflexota bacterium]